MHCIHLRSYLKYSNSTEVRLLEKFSLLPLILLSNHFFFFFLLFYNEKFPAKQMSWEHQTEHLRPPLSNLWSRPQFLAWQGVPGSSGAFLITDLKSGVSPRHSTSKYLLTSSSVDEASALLRHSLSISSLYHNCQLNQYSLITLFWSCNMIHIMCCD